MNGMLATTTLTNTDLLLKACIPDEVFVLLEYRLSPKHLSAPK